MVASVETGLLLGNHLGHQTVCFVNYPHTHPKNLTTSSLLHLDTIFNETAMQNKHAKKVRGTRAMTLAAE